MSNMLINASQWPAIQYGGKIIYSPSATMLGQIQKLNIDSFWRQIYTAFAVVIYDKLSQKIIAIRDHFGVEPCYYSYSSGHFVFGSTIPAVLKYIPSPATLSSVQITNLFFNKLFNTEIYSDETYYQSIYRVEPGHELHIDLNKTEIYPYKVSFWNLKHSNTSFGYSHKENYVEHFSELLSEALRVQVGQEKALAAEFSGGLDSSAMVACAIQNNIKPALFMHIAPPNSEVIDDERYAKAFIEHFGITAVNYLDAAAFDLLASMTTYAQYFAGGAPYSEAVLADNVRQAIAAQGYRLVLSGIGGDECVSSHAPLQVFIPQMIKEKGYKTAWYELQCHYARKGKLPALKIKRLWQFIKLAYPEIFHVLRQLGDTHHFLKMYIKNLQYIPRFKPNYSLRDYEYDRLQGAASHHLRMRIEYNTVASKSLGFNYAYPLLYPKLVEFCYQLPLEQKRMDGNARCLIRQYLTQFLPHELYAGYSKSGAVTPATFEKIRKEQHSGLFKEAFTNLPFKKERQYMQKRAKQINKDLFIQTIPSFMFKAYWANHTQGGINNEYKE